MTRGCDSAVMPMPTTVREAEDASVGMGMAIFARAPARLTAVVGSCIGVAIYSPRLRLGMLSHVVLPCAKGHTAYPAKYADTAVRHMRAMLESRGASPDSLIAKIVGGACMFSDGVFMKIGEANVQAATEALNAAGIEIAGVEVGGSNGRRIMFDLATGDVTVESVACKKRTL